MIQFDLPKDQSSIIKVIGVGGGGGNAVNHMFQQNIEGVNFIVCNTDSQAIAQSKVPNKIQLGPLLTQGLGAGANPEVGKRATEESLEEIEKILEVNTKMAFITAGMGGGTGTGGAPILAQICKKLGILTVGIVTTPFSYEGKKRIAQAEEGIRLLKENVDTLLVISNDKLRHQYGNLKMKDAFTKADNVLATAAKCITDVIHSTGQINVDFADVCTVMKNGGVAILGSARAEGENRAYKAIESALNSPLLNDDDIRGAKWILININSAEGEHEFTMDEVDIIQNHLLSQAGEDTDVILGMGYDNDLGGQIGITLIATGFEHKDPFPKSEVVKDEKDKKIVLELEIPEIPKAAPKVPPVADVDNTTQNNTPTLFDSVEVGETPSKNTVEKKEEKQEIFEITSPAESPSFIVFEEHIKEDVTGHLEEPEKEEASNMNSLSSGSLPVKPSNIYVEAKPTQQSNSTEEPQPLHIKLQADEPATEMFVVVKDSQTAAEEEPVDQTQPNMFTSVEEPAMQDETEELRRRAKDRIAKLRSLSFNINASDPNSEFEAVPAYLRRNMEMHNQIANVDSFYSNYSVKKDVNDQTVISTLNSYLHGKKPD